MANPFKKAEEAKKVPPGSKGGKTDETVTVTDVVIEEEVPTAVEETPEVTAPEKVEEVPKKDASEPAKPKKTAKKKKKTIPGGIAPKEKKKTYGYYIPVAVAEELEAIAAENDINVSTLVSAILQNYLDGEE